MKNKLIVFYFLLFSFASAAQVQTSIDGIFGVDFISSNNYNGFGNSTYGKTPSFRFGANFNFLVYEKSYIKTGIRYTKQSENTYIFNTTTTGFPALIEEFYLEFPLLYRYEFNKKKFKPFFEAGVAPYYYINGKRTNDMFGNISVEDYDPPYLEKRRFRIALIFALGFQYNLSQQFQFFVQPTYRYFLPINFAAARTVTSRNFGFEVGIRKALSFVNSER